jgi:hypothetical protein
MAGTLPVMWMPTAFTGLNAVLMSRRASWLARWLSCW